MSGSVARKVSGLWVYLSSKRMTAFISVCVALAISAFYELIEWWAALALDTGRMISLVRKVTRGIHNQTCFWL